MEIKGRIVKVLGETQGTNQQGQPWRKFEYLFGYYENPSDLYERNIVVSFMNDRVDQFKNFKEGDKVKVRVALTCREYPQFSGHYFNDIRTGDMVLIEANQQHQQVATNGDPSVNGPTPQPQTNEGGGDDLPF